MAPHSSTLALKIPWMEEPGRLQSTGSLRVRHNWVTSLSLFLSCIREGNGNPLQRSCLENPRDGGAWWAAVYGVAQSQTRLKRLGSSSSSILLCGLGHSRHTHCVWLSIILWTVAHQTPPSLGFSRQEYWSGLSFPSPMHACYPIDGSPPGSPIPGILQARTLEWVTISFSDAWKGKWKWSRSVVSDS